MSCYVLAPAHYAAIAAFITAHGENQSLWVHHPASGTSDYVPAKAVADAMQAENVRSYNSRYRVSEVVEAFKPTTVTPSPAEMAGILRSWDYQSCETTDYRESLAYEMRIQLMDLVLKVVGDTAAKADPDATKTYTWA